VNRELADVTAREEQRADDKGISCEGDSRGADAIIATEAEGRLILEGRQDLIAESGDEQALDELVR
jgi:hypothetical protein